MPSLREHLGTDFQQDLLAGRPHVFYLRDGRSGNVLGPFDFLADARLRIAGETFSLFAADRPARVLSEERFQLRSHKNGLRYGPFRFAEGTKLVIAGAGYTLALTNPQPDGPRRKP